MALINREELLNAFGLSEKTRKYGGDHSGYDTRMLYEIQDTIEGAEEVEAIPVEWIESYLSGCAVGSIAYYVIKQMLYKWKEEQNG